MTKLTCDISRTYELGHINNHPVKAGEKIFEGSAVGIDENGFARALVAGDKFVGFAEKGVDKTNGENGEFFVIVKEKGRIVLKNSDFSYSDVGKKVYASDDNTFTLTKENNSVIGTIVRVSETETVVSFSAINE